MRQKKASQKILNLTILSLLTVTVWVSFAVYESLSRTKIKPDVRKQLTPLNPKVDTEIITGLKNKREISLEEILSSSFPSEPTLEEEPLAQEDLEEQQATKSGETSSP